MLVHHSRQLSNFVYTFFFFSIFRRTKKKTMFYYPLKSKLIVCFYFWMAFKFSKNVNDKIKYNYKYKYKWIVKWDGDRIHKIVHLKSRKSFQYWHVFNAMYGRTNERMKGTTIKWGDKTNATRIHVNSLAGSSCFAISTTQKRAHQSNAHYKF